ncbi:MAG: hypothetical protein RL513_103 [Pseudomonadota bacterium]|jgi:hypothetical protein
MNPWPIAISILLAGGLIAWGWRAPRFQIASGGTGTAWVIDQQSGEVRVLTMGQDAGPGVLVRPGEGR